MNGGKYKYLFAGFIVRVFFNFLKSSKIIFVSSSLTFILNNYFRPEVFSSELAFNLKKSEANGH